MKCFAERWVERQLKAHPPGEEISDADLAKREDPKNGVITVRDDEVEVRHPKSVASVRWSEIREVFGYKRDLLTIDLISLALCSADDAPIVEPNEDMQGFVTLWRELEWRLPGFSDAYNQWLLSSPAFDAQPTSIWKRET